MNELIDLRTLLAVLAGGATIYAAIRADLAALHVKADEALRSSAKAHKRLDNHIGGYHDKA